MISGVDYRHGGTGEDYLALSRSRITEQGALNHMVREWSDISKFNERTIGICFFVTLHVIVPHQLVEELKSHSVALAAISYSTQCCPVKCAKIED